LEKTNSNFRLVATMAEMAHSGREWKRETGVINGQKLARHLGTLQGAIYYIAGPPPMVAAMREMLVGAGVDEDDVRTEEFGGY
jgi:ferredoxin-NADP reductase